MTASEEFQAKYVLIAKTAHSANRTLQELLLEWLSPEWEFLDECAQESRIDAVIFVEANPGATPEDMHKRWLRAQSEQGWTYGEIYDLSHMKHPDMIPFEHLPVMAEFKSKLFLSIVRPLLQRELHSLIQSDQGVAPEDVRSA